MLGTLADRLAGEDKSTAIMTGMTMAVQGVSQIGGAMANGAEVSQSVAKNQDMAVVVGAER